MFIVTVCRRNAVSLTDWHSYTKQTHSYRIKGAGSCSSHSPAWLHKAQQPLPTCLAKPQNQLQHQGRKGEGLKSALSCKVLFLWASTKHRWSLLWVKTILHLENSTEEEKPEGKGEKSVHASTLLCKQSCTPLISSKCSCAQQEYVQTKPVSQRDEGISSCQ